MADPPTHGLSWPFRNPTLDVVIRVMAETGREMNTKFKKTSKGGLAVSMVECGASYFCATD